MSSTRAEAVSIHAVSPELISACAVSGSSTTTNRASIIFNTGHPLFVRRLDATLLQHGLFSCPDYSTRQGKRGGSRLGVATARLLINRFPPLGTHREACPRPLSGVTRLARRLLVKPHAYTEAWNDKRNP